MSLNAQQQALADTLDALVRYVNQRQHLVREDPAQSDEERMLRQHLVLRYLWQHTSLLEDFIRENPEHLSVPLLAIAQGLEGVLYGSLFVAEQGDRTLTLLHDTGAYMVDRPSDVELPVTDEVIELRCALIPLMGTIVALPPFAVLGTVPPSFVTNLRERLAARCDDEPTSNGHVLYERSRAWQKKRAAEEARRAANTKACAPGYHRGPLAGIDGEDRRSMRQAHSDAAALEDGSFRQSMEARAIETSELPVTLEDGLALLDDDWLCSIAQMVTGEEEMPDLPHGRLAHWLAERMSHQKSDLEFALMWCEQSQFDLMRHLMFTNPYSLDGLTPSGSHGLYPLEPQVFFIHEGASLLAWMPPEIASLMSQVDIEAIARARERLRLAAASAAGLATMCGIISISDAYELYCRVVDDPLERDQYEEALSALSTCASRDGFTIWQHEGTDYVISVEISDESALARVARESYAERLIIPCSSDASDDTAVLPLTIEDEREFSRRLSQKEHELQRLRLSLLQAKDEGTPHELLTSMLDDEPVQALLETRALRDLRAFVDCHIPDQEDDYEFADLFARSVVVSVVLMNENYNDTMDLIRLYAMLGCEGTPFPDTLGRLVTNAYNALPRWQHNGWSLEELTERLSGRRRFFAPDGKELAISAGEPCPCGSGKPYEHCCGNVA